MERKMFTKEQIKELLKNENVLKCSAKAITYKPEFKLGVVKQYYKYGFTAKEMFLDSGFDLSVIGEDKPRYLLKDWRKLYDKFGDDGLLKDRRGMDKGGGRPRTRGMTDQEKIERLEATVAYLKAENDFLTKLRAGRTE